LRLITHKENTQESIKTWVFVGFLVTKPSCDTFLEIIYFG